MKMSVDLEIKKVDGQKGINPEASRGRNSLKTHQKKRVGRNLGLMVHLMVHLTGKPAGRCTQFGGGAVEFRVYYLISLDLSSAAYCRCFHNFPTL
jgi:hypothetical protein